MASFAVAGRDRGFDEKQREVINLEVGRAYRENIRSFSAMGNLELWYTRIEVDDLLVRLREQASAKQLKAGMKRLEANVAKARTKDSIKAFAKLTTVEDGVPRITGDPPLIVPIEDVAGERASEVEDVLRGVVRSYRRTLAGDRRRLLERYRYVHAARKVVGVGSVGNPCLDLPSARAGWRRSALPPVQGGPDARSSSRSSGAASLRTRVNVSSRGSG